MNQCLPASELAASEIPGTVISGGLGRPVSCWAPPRPYSESRSEKYCLSEEGGEPERDHVERDTRRRCDPRRT